MKQKKFVKDISAATLATGMVGAATCCYVRAGLGGDSVAVFFDGLSSFAGISLGTASWLFNLVLIITACLMARKHLGWTTIYNSLLNGLFVDLANWALDPVLGFSDSLLYRWVLMLSGLLLLGSSCALMMRHCPGMSVLDAITAGVADRVGWSFRVVRIGIDVVLMLIGFVLGGVVGLGTIVAVLGTGPVIQFFYQLGNKK